MKITHPLILSDHSVDFSMCVTMHRKKLEGFVGMVRKVCKLLHILHVHVCILSAKFSPILFHNNDKTPSM